MRRTSSRVTVLVAATIGALAAGLAPALQTSAAPAAAPAPPVVEFGECPRGYPQAAECARPRVPLDHDEPAGVTTRLFIARVPARDPDARIGSLFVNPGGPGGSAAEFAAFAARFFPAEVRDSFDIVGIDPRGIGGSSPVRCRATEDPPPFPRVAYPIRPREITRQIRNDEWLRDACRQRGNAILDHMTTADTARDMDLIRQALGDDQLSYYGISYGSQLGTTYAAMFPDSIRALVVDAVLDPIGWTTGRGDQARTLPFSARLKSQTGSYDSLVDAFAACDRAGRQRCALAGGAERTWRLMLRALSDGPVRVQGFGRLYYQDLVSQARGTLYSGPSIKRFFGVLERLSGRLLGGGDARGVGDALRSLERSLHDSARERLVPGPYGLHRWRPAARGGGGVVFPSFEGVACSDSLNPRRERKWAAAADTAERTGRWFGRVWTWFSGACARWPGDDSDAYRGPFDLETSAPLLVIGNTHDPATPYDTAITVADLFPRATLLTLDDYGHAAFASNDCIDAEVEDYLVDLRTPTPGRTCRAERPLFPRR